MLIKIRNFASKIVAARNFAISVVIHVVLLVFLFSVVVYEAVQRTQEFQTTLILGDGFGGGGEPPPPPSMPVDAPDMQDLQVFSSDVPLTDLLTVDSASAISFNIAPPVIPPPDAIRSATAANTSPTLSTPSTSAGISRERASMIRGMTQEWFQGRGTGSGGARGIVAEFPIYVGRTEAPGSAAFVRINPQNNRVIGGSVPNLAEMIRFMSNGRIKPLIQGEMIRLSSDEIFKKKPPFIFLTGRGDFKLTEQEVKNMQDYLLMGGCIWGDAALPGRGSSFDIAFRREMRRIVGEGVDFRPLPPNHPVYSSQFFRMTGPPAGINFKREPVESLTIDGIEAVIYTMNGYGAMWQIMLRENDFNSIDTTVMIASDSEFWARRNTIFRNLDEKSLLASYQLGINMVAYLLTRFESALRFAR